MKKFLLIFLYFLFISCSVIKNNTLVGVDIETEMKVTPITADLLVSDQKKIGEATGLVANRNDVTKQALAKALGQDPPSADGYDMLVAQNTFSEVDGSDLKVTVTGYPAHYTNFRPATEKDSLRLNIINNNNSLHLFGRSYADSLNLRLDLINSRNRFSNPRNRVGSSTGNALDSSAVNMVDNSAWYFSVRYMFGDNFGWGIGAGKSWSNVFFLGLEVEEMGILSPWKDTDDLSYFGIGGGLNLGGIYSGLPYDLGLVGGIFADFWYCDYEFDNGIYSDSGNNGGVFFFGPFVKLRWNGLEAGLKWMLFAPDDEDWKTSEDESSFKFSLGYTYTF